MIIYVLRYSLIISVFVVTLGFLSKNLQMSDSQLYTRVLNWGLFLGFIITTPILMRKIQIKLKEQASYSKIVLYSYLCLLFYTIFYLLFSQILNLNNSSSQPLKLLENTCIMIMLFTPIILISAIFFKKIKIADSKKNNI